MRTPEEKLRVELAAAKDLADFRADQLVVAMGKYASPDGAKRLELLEELAAGFAEWVRASPTLFDHRHTRDIAKISRAITWDNARVDRLEQESEEDGYVPYDSFDTSTPVGKDLNRK